MSFRQAPQGSEEGFTLIEILLAVSLIAMMATLVFGSLYVTMSAIETAQAKSADEQIVRRTLRLMSWQSAKVVQPARGWVSTTSETVNRQIRSPFSQWASFEGRIRPKIPSWSVSSTPEKAIVSFDFPEETSMV
jgi:prepilin-type N-terminal cleavage/methylation domain-containing protein